MAASTITRDTWTNDTGSAAAPNGDGTILNNSVLQNNIYARIDELFAGAGSYATLTLGGKVAVEGFGNHLFSAGGTGANSLQVRNTTAGTGNYGELAVGNNSSATRSVIRMHSTTFTTATQSVQDGMLIQSAGVGGLSISVTDAAGDIRLYTNGTLRTTWDETGLLSHSGSVNAPYYMQVVNSNAGSATLCLVRTSNGTNTTDIYQTGTSYTASSYIPQDGGMLVTSGAGGLSVIATNGSGTVRLYAGGANLGASFSSSGGTVYHADGSVSAPSIAFFSDTNTGLYRETADRVTLTGGGTNVARFSFATCPVFQVPPGGFGAGAVSGCGVQAGNNTSSTGAPGYVTYYDKSSNFWSTWADSSGNLRIWNSAAGPTVTDGDTVGTVVGTQTSTRASKLIHGRFMDRQAALDLMLATPLYAFEYKNGAYNSSQFVGIVAEDSPTFAMDDGRVFNPISAFGYTVAAIQALHDRIHALEQVA